MKRILTLLFIAISLNGYSQSQYDFKVRNKLTVVNEFELDDSSVVAITTGDTLATKEWTTANAAILTGSDTEVYFKQGGVLASNPSFTYDSTGHTLNTDSLQLGTGEKLSWNAEKRTINIPTGSGSIIQAGRELQINVYNNTGGLIPNGSAVYPIGNFNDVNTIALAQSNTHESIGLDYGLATVSIDDNSYGDVVWFGEANNINTSMYDLGDSVWISATVAGEITNVRPGFPNYDMFIGIVNKVGVTDGIIFVTNKSSINDTYDNFHNGTFREPFDFRVISDGTTIKGYIEPTDGHPDLTAILSSGLFTFDTSPADTIILTAGTNINPQTNYVYIPTSTKQLTISTTSFPITEHVPVAILELQSASMTAITDAIKNQNINNFVQRVDNNMGMLYTIGDRIRIMDAVWGRVGCEGSLSGTPNDLYVAVTEGIVYQMNKQTYAAKDMSSGDLAFIVNDPITAYDTTSNFNTITTDALGGSINNVWTNIAIWGVVNKTGEISQLMCNLPVGTYNSEANAVADLLNYTVYDIPNKFKGVGFLIGRFTFRKSGTTFTYNPSVGYFDLRGKFPNTTVGLAGGSSGITTFLGLTDTESSFTAYEFQVANAGATALESPAELTLNDSLKLSSGNLVITDTVKVGDAIGIGTSTPLTPLHINRGYGFNSGLSFTPTSNIQLYAQASDQALMVVSSTVSAIFSTGGISSGSSTGNALLNNAVSTSTIPGHNFWNDFDVGVGYGGSDDGRLIAGGKSILSFKENVYEQALINPEGDFTGTLANPSLAISETGTGFYKPNTNSLRAVINTIKAFEIFEDSTYHDSIAVFNSGIKFSDGEIQTTAGVTKVGTPLDNQIGIWTGDGTIEGDPNLVFTGTAFEVNGTITFGGGTSGDDAFKILGDPGNSDLSISIGDLDGSDNNTQLVVNDEIATIILTSDTIEINGDTYINGTLVHEIGTIANNDATPDVSGGNVWKYNGTANSVTITDLDNPVAGAIYTILGNSDTYQLGINDGSPFYLAGGSAWSGLNNSSITLICIADNHYVEIARSERGL